jgi:outer membrane protein assembly factor BamB
VRRPLAIVLLLLAACGGASATTSRTTSAAHDWPMFGVTPARSSSGPANGITSANVRRLHRQVVQLDGTVDSSPIYLHDVRVGAKTHDTFFFTTTYGRTEAVDAASGRVLWRYTPPSYRSVVGSAQITNSVPVADPGRAFVYAASPDGVVQKLSVRTGKPAWRTAITRLPSREKIASALNFAGGHLIATTGGYIGDAPPYQGHVVLLDPRSGKIVAVWNSLCSDRHQLIDPSSCNAQLSAIWGRSGAVVDPASGDVLVASGNAPFDGKTNWGDSLIRLSPDLATIKGTWTPTDYARLESADIDLGSTSPVVLGGGYFAQSGKDGKLRLLNAKSMSPAGHTGGELQTIPTPGGTDLFTAPAVWRAGAGAWLFVGDNAGLAAWRLKAGRLEKVWENSTGSTSPVVANGLLYAYDPGGSGLHVYAAVSGRQLAVLPAGEGHWNAPIAVDGRVALPEGTANAHDSHGVLSIYRLR